MNQDGTDQGNGFFTPDRSVRRDEVEKMTVTQLRIKLKSLKLPVYGCKRTLCQRLLTTTSDATSQSQFSHKAFPVFEQIPSQNSYSKLSSGSSSIAKCRLVDLRKRCKSAGLPTSGRKQELIDRLEVYYEKAILNDLLDSKDSSSVESHWGVSKSFSFFDEPLNNQTFSQQGINLDVRSFKDPTELAKLNKVTLQQLCRDLQLRVSGKKEVIVDRLWNQITYLKSSLTLTQNYESSVRPTSRRMNGISVDDKDLSKKRKFRSDGLGVEGSSRKRSRNRVETNNTDEGLESSVSLTLNEYFQKAKSLRFYIFSTKLDSDHFSCSILCEEDSDKTPYTVTIGNSMSCTCSHCDSYHLCHHVFFILWRILRRTYPDPIYLKTTLSRIDLLVFLKDIKQNLRVVQGTKSALKKRFFTRANVSNGEDTGSIEVIRENWVGKSCGVCFLPLSSMSSMIWCRALCGKNMHMSCYDKWLEQQEVDEHKCPYCFEAWGTLPKNTRFQSNLKRSRIE